MTILEALRIAKEKGKKVRPIGANQYISFKEGNMCYTNLNTGITICGGATYFTLDDILTDWEVVREKPSKELQYKIDSMKFQIVRYCRHRKCSNKCKLLKYCGGEITCLKNTPRNNLLDDWSLKEIVGAYRILKKEGEII